MKKLNLFIVKKRMNRLETKIQKIQNIFGRFSAIKGKLSSPEALRLDRKLKRCWKKYNTLEDRMYSLEEQIERDKHAK